MAKMTLGGVQDLLSRFATDNLRYRVLFASPKGGIDRQLTTSLGSVQVKATTGDLSGADLQKVAGRFDLINAECPYAAGPPARASPRGTLGARKTLFVPG